MTTQAKSFSKQVTVDITLSYLLYLPDGYTSGSEERWPLVLFLHGAGERGNDLDKLKKHALPRLVEEGRDFPFILVSPQCPRAYWWSISPILTVLGGLLDDVEQTYRVDPERIYLTGLSMGGYGSWDLAVKYPDRFAALVPICGSATDNDQLYRIRHIPTRVFHGDKDNVVPLDRVAASVEALKASGGNVKFTVYPGVGHDSWTPAYNEPELYEWLLSQRRSANV